MSSSMWLMAVAQNLPPLMVGTNSPADPSCNVAEVARLLWTMVAVAGGAGLMAVLRPSWRWVMGLAAACLLWAWIDMEGAVLVSRGSHGVHVADLPILISLVAIVAGIVRLWRRRSSTPVASS